MQCKGGAGWCWRAGCLAPTGEIRSTLSDSRDDRRQTSRLIVKAAVPGYTVDYDWTFLDNGRIIAGVWRDDAGFGASVGERTSGYGDPPPPPPPPPPAKPSLAGAWTINGQPTSITQDNGGNLVFTNERGDQSAGSFADSATVVASGWGGLRGSIENGGNTIRWANGTVWLRRGAAGTMRK
jgi:hypothetical protein